MRCNSPRFRLEVTKTYDMVEQETAEAEQDSSFCVAVQLLLLGLSSSPAEESVLDESKDHENGFSMDI